MKRYWRRFKLKATKPWRWLRYRWRMYREPCVLTKNKMQIGWAMSDSLTLTCLAVADWAEDNRELIDAVSEAELKENDHEES